MTQQTAAPIDTPRLLAGVRHYARQAGADPAPMLSLLSSQLGRACLQLASSDEASTTSLDSLLVNDLYKVHMQSMYAQYMTGVTADFVLNIRKCPPLPGSSNSSSSGANSTQPAAHVLTEVKQRHPGIYSQLTERTSHQIQAIEPLGSAVLDALQEFNDYTPPQVLLERLHAHGVAPVEWVDIDGAPVAMGSGPIEAASNTETTVMQAVQAAIIAAAAEEAEAQTAAANAGISGSTAAGSSDDRQQWLGPPLCLDRTERLANSLGKMVATVQQLNEIPHECGIMLMAGRRSTDLLHLLLQNLYFMQHVRGYVGTSSLLAAAVLRRLLEQQGVGREQRKALVGRIMGTHAHEMTSMVQQLMCGYDAEAGRRCGLEVSVCVSQLLAHLLFLTANGGSSQGSTSTSSSSAGGTALADTFTTPYFVRLAELTDLPAEFVEDMRVKWGIHLEAAGSKVFDLFSVWRLDSGSYPDLAQLLHDTWTRRRKARAAGGLLPLAPLRLLHSNISTLDDICELVSLPPHIRPVMLGFGGLADGFMPFDVTTTAAAATPATALASSMPPCPPAAAAAPTAGAAAPVTAVAAAPPPPAPTAQPLTLPVCSLVMKAVQARLAGHRNSLDITQTTTDAPAGPTASASTPPTPAAAADVSHVHPAPTGAAAAAPGAARAPEAARAPAAPAAPGAPAAAEAPAGVLLSVHQACAIKLGDGSLSKAQTDPRLPAKTREAVLGQMQAMVAAGAQLGLGGGQQVISQLSEVLREAYVAVVRQGVLQMPAE